MSSKVRAFVVKRIEDDKVREKLEAMAVNPKLNAPSTSLRTKAVLYPEGDDSFVDKHITYLLNHPNVKPDQYLSNLKLMLKKRD